MIVQQRIEEFNLARRDALRRIWFVGDVHGQFKHLARSLMAAYVQPRWIVFAGDIDIDHRPFREILEPLKRWDSNTQVAFIHGNHDADTHDHWNMLHDCGDAVPIHGKVVDMDGIRVAGLGGHFLREIWKPPAQALHADIDVARSARALPSYGRLLPASDYLGAIYPQDVQALASQEADILITHEAPSCHHEGFEELDRLARSLRVQRAFHGHHHDDRTADYALERERLGFDAVALRHCAIKNGLGEEIFSGEEGW